VMQPKTMVVNFQSKQTQPDLNTDRRIKRRNPTTWPK